MKDIIVCVKQIPNTDKVALDRKDHTLIREGIENILNPADDNALEAAMILKDKFGIEVGVVTMGPAQAREVLEYCLSKGADEAFLLNDKKMAGSDTLATSKVLAAFIKKSGYKNIFCGQESADSGTAHIGPAIAEILGLPQIMNSIEVSGFDEDIIRVKTKYDNEYRIFEAKTPAVVAFIKGKLKSAKRKTEFDKNKIRKFGLDYIDINESEVGLEGSPTWVINIDVDEEILDYLRVDSSLSADDRISYILSGGIEENTNRTIINDLSKNSIDKILKAIS
jgi:electron transfer flavoprotein alpha/beta subunit